jgi:hypothetical protein
MHIRITKQNFQESFWDYTVLFFIALCYKCLFMWPVPDCMENTKEYYVLYVVKWLLFPRTSAFTGKSSMTWTILLSCRLEIILLLKVISKIHIWTWAYRRNFQMCEYIGIKNYTTHRVYPTNKWYLWTSWVLRIQLFLLAVLFLSQCHSERASWIILKHSTIMTAAHLLDNSIFSSSVVSGLLLFKA